MPTDVINQANDDHAPITIPQNNGKHAVLISTKDFTAYQETTYLLRSPENAKRLLTAFSDLRL
ncbi:type II toxin-antitoxin system prevent-host-death family antitoxin [Candidatus Albibeggiatoa sp. nov. BB20]|uniref:type II toxin-antitoxin system Phd/YefM family antitoxin n=1 Tax=Candidatus Albibeggiatoa sp. nov. BB20 TaxID=3162723 RepID=UPI00336577D8